MCYVVRDIYSLPYETIYYVYTITNTLGQRMTLETLTIMTLWEMWQHYVKIVLPK